MSKPTHKIYLFVAPDLFGELTGHALAESGHLLASAVFPDVPTAQVRMGLTGRRVKAYSRHYPDGYEIVWIDDFETHPGCVEARRLNAELWNAARPEREAEYAHQMAAKAAAYRLGAVVATEDGADLAVNQADCWVGEAG